jgi:hypothetical protein
VHTGIWFNLRAIGNFSGILFSPSKIVKKKIKKKSFFACFLNKALINFDVSRLKNKLFFK